MSEPVTKMSVVEIVAGLVAATPAVPAPSVPSADVADLGGKMLDDRQPWLNALGSALAGGSVLDADSRKKLEALQVLDTAWRQALVAAQDAISGQLVALRRMEGRRTSSSSGGPFVDIKA